MTTHHRRWSQKRADPVRRMRDALAAQTLSRIQELVAELRIVTDNVDQQVDALEKQEQRNE